MAQTTVVTEAITALGEMFGKDVSPTLNAMYAAALDDLTDAEVMSAASQAARTLTFFPKPVELRELARGTQADAATCAWLTVRKALRDCGTGKSVDLGDGYSHWAIEQLGGWTEVGLWTTADMPFHEKRFVDAYRLARQMGYKTPYLVGRYELENGARGLPTPNGIVRVSLGGTVEEPLALPEVVFPEECDEPVSELSGTVEDRAAAITRRMSIREGAA